MEAHLTAHPTPAVQLKAITTLFRVHSVSEQRRQPKKKKKTANIRNTASGGEATQASQQPSRGATLPGQQQQQVRCLQCRRHGHSQAQCPRKTCDYCQGRFHSSLNCRVRIADERQQQLVETVRQTSQETLSALRGVAFQLQHPAAQQRVAPTIVTPTSLPSGRSPWTLPQHPQPLAFQYAAVPQQFTAMPHPYQ